MCELDRGNKHIQRAPDRYLKLIDQLLACMRYDDPVPVLRLAVLVELPNKPYQLLLGPKTSPRYQLLEHLILIGFYYLLRVGKKLTKQITK